MDKIKGFEVMWTSKNRNVAVTYNRFGLGSRYNVYRKVIFEIWCEELCCHWEYVDSFDSILQAENYAKSIPDIPVEHSASDGGVPVYG